MMNSSNLKEKNKERQRWRAAAYSHSAEGSAAQEGDCCSSSTLRLFAATHRVAAAAADMQLAVCSVQQQLLVCSLLLKRLFFAAASFRCRSFRLKSSRCEVTLFLRGVCVYAILRERAVAAAAAAAKKATSLLL